jgi:hypothetical protein
VLIGLDASAADGSGHNITGVVLHTLSFQGRPARHNAWRNVGRGAHQLGAAVSPRSRLRHYGMTLTARAATSTSVRSAMALSSIIRSFARGVSGSTSVGLNAVAVLNARKR